MSTTATLRRDVVGGLTTFLTMAYIVIVNPAVLAEAGMDFGAVMLIGIPFTWSIADGIAFGFIARPVLKLAAGRGGEASPLAYALAVLFVLRYALL